MALNRASDASAADWLYQHTREKVSKYFTCGDKVFLSGGNPYKALQFI